MEKVILTKENAAQAVNEVVANLKNGNSTIIECENHDYSIGKEVINGIKCIVLKCEYKEWLNGSHVMVSYGKSANRFPSAVEEAVDGMVDCIRFVEYDEKLSGVKAE